MPSLLKNSSAFLKGVGRVNHSVEAQGIQHLVKLNFLSWNLIMKKDLRVEISLIISVAEVLKAFHCVLEKSM